MLIGTHKNIQIDDDLDSDGELPLEFVQAADWLTKSMTVSVIRHMAKVFDLEVILEAVERYEEDNAPCCKNCKHDGNQQVFNTACTGCGADVEHEHFERRI